MNLLLRRVRDLLDDVRFRVAAAAILGTLPAAIIIAWTAVNSDRDLERQALDDAMRAAGNVSSRMQELFESTRRGLLGNAYLTAHNRSLPVCHEAFRAFVSRQPWLTAAWSGPPSGIVECDSTGRVLGTDRSARRDFVQAVETGEFAIGEYRLGAATGRPVIPMSLPIFDDEKRLVGVLGAALDVSWANALVEASALPPETMVSIVSDDLTTLFRNIEPARYVGRKLEAAEVVRHLVDRTATAFRAEGADGVERIYGVARLQAAQLSVLVGIPEAEVLLESRAWARSALLAIAASTFCSLILLVVLLRRLVLRPVDLLVDAASSLGAGTGTARIGSIMIGGQLGKLASTFDAMADQIDARERALRESKDRLHAITEHSVDGLVTIDERGTILTFNGPAEKIFGYSANEVVGRNVRMLMPEPYRSSHDNYLARYFRTGEGTFIGASREVEGRRKDGSVFSMDIAVGEIPMPSGSRQFVGTVRDITQRKAIEEKLRQAQKMDAVGQLTGGIAHDFNNLLAVIMGNLELIADRTGETEPERKLVDAALHASVRGADLTRRLLTFSRHQPLQPEPVAVNDVVRGTIDLLNRTLGKTIQIETRLADDVGAVLVDPGQLENALLNLALNARDAMPKGGRLLIETRNTQLDEGNAAAWKDVIPGPHVLISVTDSGAGMTPEVAARAFEPFFTTKDVGKGTGLGLSMVYGFVKQSGGQIGIDSEPGHGTTIRIYLPDLAREGAMPAPGIARLNASPGRGEHVLVVEDNEDVRRLVIRQLTSLGYRVETAADGREAEAHLRGRAVVDLLISDVVLPGGMSGVEVASAARSLRPGLPVLYMSGYTEGIIDAGRLTAEGSVLLTKPFTKAQLSAAIEQALGKRRKAS